MLGICGQRKLDEHSTGDLGVSMQTLSGWSDTKIESKVLCKRRPSNQGSGLLRHLCTCHKLDDSASNVNPLDDPRAPYQTSGLHGGV